MRAGILGLLRASWCRECSPRRTRGLLHSRAPACYLHVVINRPFGLSRNGIWAADMASFLAGVRAYDPRFAGELEALGIDEATLLDLLDAEAAEDREDFKITLGSILRYIHYKESPENHSEDVRTEVFLDCLTSLADGPRRLFQKEDISSHSFAILKRKEYAHIWKSLGVTGRDILRISRDFRKQRAALWPAPPKPTPVLEPAPAPAPAPQHDPPKSRSEMPVASAPPDSLDQTPAPGLSRGLGAHPSAPERHTALAPTPNPAADKTPLLPLPPLSPQPIAAAPEPTLETELEQHICHTEEWDALLSFDPLPRGVHAEPGEPAPRRLQKGMAKAAAALAAESRMEEVFLYRGFVVEVLGADEKLAVVAFQAPHGRAFAVLYAPPKGLRPTAAVEFTLQPAAESFPHASRAALDQALGGRPELDAWRCDCVVDQLRVVSAETAAHAGAHLGYVAHAGPGGGLVKLSFSGHVLPFLPAAACGALEEGTICDVSVGAEGAVKRVRALNPGVQFSYTCATVVHAKGAHGVCLPLDPEVTPGALLFAQESHGLRPGDVVLTTPFKLRFRRGHGGAPGSFLWLTFPACKLTERLRGAMEKTAKKFSGKFGLIRPFERVRVPERFDMPHQGTITYPLHIDLNTFFHELADVSCVAFSLYEHGSGANPTRCGLIEGLVSPPPGVWAVAERDERTRHLVARQGDDVAYVSTLLSARLPVPCRIRVKRWVRVPFRSLDEPRRGRIVTVISKCALVAAPDTPRAE
eukprot:gnl/Chilomastix_cuspidata/2435.p1 GENE.gnl/Chilomastix_cuspidata/2435~~gnl/Chilomastix_cuspidata/2435.p1  ORF type:complete len:754 (+),score=311.26 gnl/Chilomastix_cuspidata/2435:410-2671(+)